MYQFIKNSTTSGIHLCPYVPGNDFDIINYTDTIKNVGRFLPKGDYKISVDLYDGPDHAKVDLAFTVKIRTGDEF